MRLMLCDMSNGVCGGDRGGEGRLYLIQLKGSEKTWKDFETTSDKSELLSSKGDLVTLEDYGKNAY